jgi:hypothetical protein
MTGRWSCVLAALLCACAQGNDAKPDARVYLDAPVDISLVDTPPLRTLSQTTSSTLEPATAGACPIQPSGTAANNYYRVFDLASFGITRPFNVYRVEFQVEHCHQFSANKGCDVIVRIGTYAGAVADTLTLADMVILSSANAHIPEIIETLDPPMTPGGTVAASFNSMVPADTKLLVEVDAPNGSAEYALYMGANNDGELAPAYVLSPQCQITTPTNISTVAGRPIHLLLTVSGTY